MPEELCSHRHRACQRTSSVRVVNVCQRTIATDVHICVARSLKLSMVMLKPLSSKRFTNPVMNMSLCNHEATP